MQIKRIGPLSAAKIGGVLYAGLGLLIGACVSLVMMALGGAAALSEDQSGGPFFGMLFGAGAIVMMPIFYGVFGAIMMAITAALYNLAAKVAGGIEIDVQQ
ncbi:MAG TPA: DUF3566 domain-containing protein [Vicinamibacterales bacterium]|jgi:hypothetical protein